MKEACPSKWSQSGEMSSEDTAAAFSASQALLLPIPQNPVHLSPREAGRLGRLHPQPFHPFLC